MATCTDTIPVENLDSCATDEVAAGISEVGVYGCPVKDFLTIEKPAGFDTATANADLATIAAAHTFDVGKGFHKVDFIPNTGLVETAQVGETGNLSFQNSLTGGIKGTNARKNQLAKIIINNVVWIRYNFTFSSNSI